MSQDYETPKDLVNKVPLDDITNENCNGENSSVFLELSPEISPFATSSKRSSSVSFPNSVYNGGRVSAVSNTNQNVGDISRWSSNLISASSASSSLHQLKVRIF